MEYQHFLVFQFLVFDIFVSPIFAQKSSLQSQQQNLSLCFEH